MKIVTGKFNMKKTIASLVAVIALTTGSLSAFEWGGIVSNDSKGITQNYASYSVEQSNGVFLWMNTQLSENAKWYLSSEVMYKYNFGYYGAEIGTSFKNIADMDLLKLSGSSDLGNGIFSLALGRYPILDSSGIVFNQVCDGALFSYSKTNVTFSLYTGYTGLLNGLTVSMLDAFRDETNKAVACQLKENAAVYTMAHPFVPMIFSADLSSVFGNHSLGFQTSAFFDLDKSETNTRRGTRMYGNMVMKGPLANSIFYEAVTVFGTTSFKNFTNYSRLMLFCYPSSIVSMKVGGEYASGKEQLNFDLFTTFTSKTAYNSLLSPEYGGQLIPVLTFDFYTKKVFMELNSKLVFLLPDGKFGMGGVQEDFTFLYNLFSDLQFSLNFITYLDLAGSGVDNNSYLTFSFKMTF